MTRPIYSNLCYDYILYSTVDPQYYISSLYKMYTFEMLTFLPLLIEIINVFNFVIYNNDNLLLRDLENLLDPLNVAAMFQNSILSFSSA